MDPVCSQTSKELVQEGHNEKCLEKEQKPLRSTLLVSYGSVLRQSITGHRVPQEGEGFTIHCLSMSVSRPRTPIKQTLAAIVHWTFVAMRHGGITWDTSRGAPEATSPFWGMVEGKLNQICPTPDYCNFRFKCTRLSISQAVRVALGALPLILHKACLMVEEVGLMSC